MHLEGRINLHYKYQIIQTDSTQDSVVMQCVVCFLGDWERFSSAKYKKTYFFCSKECHVLRAMNFLWLYQQNPLGYLLPY